MSWLILTLVCRSGFLQRHCALKPQIPCLDTSASGSRLKTAGSPLLAHLLRDTAEQLPHPASEKRSLWDAREDTGTLFGEHMDAEIAAIYMDELLAVDSIGVNPLGSGSDYTVFLQYHGVSEMHFVAMFLPLTVDQVPSTDGGFTSTLHDPVYHYHSAFDTQYWQELYGDPGFSRHVRTAWLVTAFELMVCAGCYCQTYWSTSASSIWRHYFTLQYHPLQPRIGIIPRQVSEVDLWIHVHSTVGFQG